jgi:hypothetical protein
MRPSLKENFARRFLTLQFVLLLFASTMVGCADKRRSNVIEPLEFFTGMPLLADMQDARLLLQDIKVFYDENRIWPQNETALYSFFQAERKPLSEPSHIHELRIIEELNGDMKIKWKNRWGKNVTVTGDLVD